MVNGPDSSVSWVMVGACFLINSVTFGIMRSYGILYVAVLGVFPVSRSAATWPFSICLATTQLVGPLAGALCQRFGARSVIFGGTLQAAIGFLACSLANNINQLSVLFGLLHGFGLGLAVMPVPVIINQFFVKHRATAQGVAFSGSTIASFAYPALLEYCVREYGLRGTFVLSAGITLHALIGATLIIRPPWLVLPKKTNALSLQKVHAFPPKGKGAWEGIESREIPMTDVESIEFDGRSSEPSTERILINTNRHRDSQSIKSSPIPQSAPSIHEEKIPQVKVVDKVKNGFLNVLRHFASGLGTIFNVMRTPMFPLIAFSWGIFIFIFMTFTLIVGDFAKDQGISDSEAVFIFSAFSMGDLIGRLGLGWVTDKKYLRRKTFAAINMSLMGGIIIFLPIGVNFTLLLIESAFLGLLVGCTFVLFLVMYAEYLKPEQVALAIGLNTAFNGLAAFLRPMVVGFFRDTLGSYSYLFYVSGSVMILTSLTWLLEPWILRRQKVREKRTQDVHTIT